MSNTESLCNEGIDSMVTDTTRDTDEQVTPKILCGLEGLGQKKEPDIVSPRWKAKLAPSVASTSQTSPVVPFQVTQKLKSSDTDGNSKQDSRSETMSPSILPQTDRWTESFSIIPSFVKKRGKTQVFESQSQSLLPQTNRQMENLTLQPSFIKTNSLGAATGSSAKSWSGTQETVGTNEQATKISKTKKSKQKKSSETKTKSPQNSVSSEKQQKKKKSSASSTHTCSSLKSLAKAVVQAQTSDASELEIKKSLHKKRPSSLTIPTQSSFKSSSDTDDITTKINERIEKQLKDLEQAPRRKMLVIEAALLHCVTSVQDNIENKLAKLKHSFKTENAETLRKLLQTLKTTLGRLIEHHKQEREEFGTAVRASQSTQEETLVQQKTQLLELGKRQKKMFILLTKQRELATKLKAIETAKKVAGEDNNTTAELPGIAVSLGIVKIRKDKNENEIIEDRDEDSVLRKKGEKNDVAVNIIDETEVVKDINSKQHKVQFIQETMKNSQNTHSDLSNTPSLFKSRTEVVDSQCSPKSGSGLMDMLKLFGSRKKQASVNDAFGNTQPASASASADQWSIGHDDVTAESSSGSFSEVEKGIQKRNDGNSVDKQFRTSKVNSAENPDKMKEVQKHPDLPENHIKEIHDKHYGSDKKKDTKTTSVSNKTLENIAQRKKCEIGRKVGVKEVDFDVEKDTERLLNEKDAKDMRANETKGKNSVGNMVNTEEDEIEIETSGEENLGQLYSKNNGKEQITLKKVQNSGETKTDSELQTKIQGVGYHRANIDDNDSNGEPFPKAFEPRRFYKQTNKTMKQLTSSEAVDVSGCVIDKDEDVMLSQDVTTIPDTQEPSTQDTLIGEQNTEDIGTTSIVQTRNKRKRSLTSDDKAPSRKKYTKMQEADERQKMDRSVCSSKAKDAAIQETASSDTRTAKTITCDREKMPLVQSVNFVSFDNSVNRVSQIDSGEESASQRVSCDKSNDSSVNPLSERLWVNMMRKEPVGNTATGNRFESTYYKGSKDTDTVFMKSPGVKLDKVIKRITEEKENLFMEKKRLENDSNSPHDTNSRKKVMPAQARNLNVNETCLQLLENRGKAEKSDPIMNSKSLHDAGLAVELPQPKEQSRHLVAKANHHPIFSPPRIPHQDDPYTDISPTATSMSSDVFVVKAKELERRMKRRIKMSQKQSTCTTNGKQLIPPKVGIPTKPENRSYKTVMVPESFQIPKRSTEHRISALPNKNSVNEPVSCQTIQNQSAEAGKTVTPKTAEEKLEAVINEVIKSSSAAVDDHSQNQANTHRQQIKAYNKNSELLKSASSANFANIANNSQQNQVSGQFTADSQRQKSGQSVKIIYSGHALQQENSSIMAGKVPTSAAKTSVDLLTSKPPLPILKSLIKMGILRPGTNVLSAEMKGRTFWASLTPLGMIKTTDGQVFKTPMQWLSTLQGDGVLMKRTKSYEKIMYNGQPLLNYCSTTVEPSEDYAYEQATNCQELSEITEINWDETAEGRLHKFLSTCLIRLLQKIDLIPCYDLPENFWANNFADVKLSSDIWECVDTWD